MALWGGRFSDAPADAVFALSRSVDFDWRLAPYDLRSSLAHLRVLKSSGLLSDDIVKKIEKALNELVAEVAAGQFLPLESDEDVHSALERGLTEKIGEVGGSLRAGRSRNDQVATDLKLFAIDHMLHIADQITDLQDALIAKANEYSDAPAPGFTHMQHAQPVLFGHELAKHVHAFARDLDRIQDWLTRTAVSPLGSGALAGSGLGLAPEVTAKDLGFTSSSANSIDGVADRDFVAEALFIISMVGVHLSRIGEEWCIWEKKNPDMAELARGKAGRLIGNLTGVLAMLKGLPFAYNRDLQEDKEPLFDSIDTLRLVLPAVTGMIATTQFDREKMLKAAPEGFSLATEVADFLVRKGVPFAQAHEAAGKCVAICEAKGLQLHELSDIDLQGVHPSLTADIRQSLTVNGAIASRTTVGATGPAALKQQLTDVKAGNSAARAKISNQISAFSEMMGQ